MRTYLASTVVAAAGAAVATVLLPLVQSYSRCHHLHYCTTAATTIVTANCHYITVLQIVVIAEA